MGVCEKGSIAGISSLGLFLKFAKSWRNSLDLYVGSSKALFNAMRT